MLSRTLSKEIEEKAQRELKETSRVRDEIFKYFEDWQLENNHVQIQRSKLWLLNFTRGCGLNVQKTVTMLERYAKLKDTVPELVCNQDPLASEVQEIFKKGTLVIFGTPDLDCAIFRWNTMDPSETNLFNTVKVGIMGLEIFLNESETVMIVGQCLIIDCKGIGFGITKHYSISAIKKVFHVIFNTLPMRIKHFYFINCNTFIKFAYAMLKQVFPKHIQSVVGFYGTDYSDIYKTIPNKYFPKEYGGDNYDVDTISDEWKQKYESYRDRFLANENSILNVN